MCYNTAAAAKAAAIQALRSGILILLVPSILLFGGIFVLAFRSRERFRGSNVEDLALDRELKEWVGSLTLSDLNGLEDASVAGGPHSAWDARQEWIEDATKTSLNKTV